MGGIVRHAEIGFALVEPDRAMGWRDGGAQHRVSVEFDVGAIGHVQGFAAADRRCVCQNMGAGQELFCAETKARKQQETDGDANGCFADFASALT